MKAFIKFVQYYSFDLSSKHTMKEMNNFLAIFLKY